MKIYKSLDIGQFIPKRKRAENSSKKVTMTFSSVLFWDASIFPMIERIGRKKSIVHIFIISDLFLVAIEK
jgi:hypothetical protein